MPSNTFEKAFTAAQDGNLEEFKKLFNISDVNQYKFGQWASEGYTMLGIACKNGQLEIVKLLLSCNGIDINKGLIFQMLVEIHESPLENACKFGHLEIVKLLLSSPFLKIENENLTVNGIPIVKIRKELKEQERIEKEREKKRKQPFVSTYQVFSELCSLNEKVTKSREEFNTKVNLILPFSNELDVNNGQYEEYLNIRSVLSSCTSMINEKLTTSKLDIENNEDISHVNNIMENIGKVVESINSEQYLIKLNQYFQILDDKLQKFDEFIENYLNQDDLQNIDIQTKVESIKTIQQILERLYTTSGNSKYKKQSQEIKQLISNLLQTITNSFNNDKSLALDDFSSNLMDAMENLEKEHLELQQLLSNTKSMIPKEVQIAIYQIYVNYQNQSSNCEMLIQETIPFIVAKHEQLQNIVNIMNNYKELSEQFTTLQRKKSRLTRDLNVDKIKIDGLKEELTHITDKNELSQVEQEIKEKEQDLVEKKKNLKEFVEQINEIKLKFLQLKTIGFDIQSVLTISIVSNLNIEEMSPDLFKEIKPIHDFIGNHHLFIGIDINDKKHVIKQYTVKDNKQLENLQKELKITNKLKHFNIIQIEGFYMSSDSDHSTNNVYIVMPYYSNGNLKEFIEKQRQLNKLDLLFWERTWRQLLIAIQHIHSKGVIHCDIKPENIFVGEFNNGLYPIILGDFDISLDVQSRTMNLYTRTAISGTVEYLSPELMAGQAATFKSDMFAFGKTIKNCMTTQELTNYSSLNNLVEQCLKNSEKKRPFASDALACEFFLNETLLDEIKAQQQLESISNQSKQLKKYEQQLNQLKANMKQEKLKLEKEIKELEQKTREFNNQNTKEREEISHQLSKLKSKEKKLNEIEKEMEQSKSRQFNIILPSYWKKNVVSFYAKMYYFEDVTNSMQNIIQEIINISCNSTTLGKGRDQQVKMKYSKLTVSSVWRIENCTLFTSFKSRMNHMASYQDPLNSLQVQTERTSSTSKSFEWMKTVGLNSSMNEKCLWHGTKPEFVQTIAEHGFDERVASLNGLFGAGVYFAEYCSKSDQYCTPDQNDEYTLLLCRVVLGRQIYFTPQGLKNQRRPPEINNGKNRRVYDSVIGQSNSSSNSYRELIVYDRYQCYPEYIIKYKRQ